MEHELQVGGQEIIGRIVEDLKDESEPYRRMVMETIEKVGVAFVLASPSLSILFHCLFCV